MSFEFARYAVSPAMGSMLHVAVARKSRRVLLALVLFWIGQAPTWAQDFPDEWRIESYPDPMHKGGRMAFAERGAESPSGRRLDAQIRCWSATHEFDVRFVLRDGRFESDEVRWRFDRGQVQARAWRRSVGLDALVVPSTLNDTMLRSLRSGREFLIWTPPETEPFRLSLDGSAAAFVEFDLTCGKLPPVRRDRSGRVAH